MKATGFVFLNDLLGAVRLDDVSGTPTNSPFVDGQWFQVAKTGQFFSPVYGEIVISPQDLATMYQNFKTKTPKAPTQLPIDYDHLSDDPQKPEDGKAAGWVQDLQMGADGQSLWVKPLWTKRAAQMIADGEYRFVSPYFLTDYLDKDSGQRIGPTLKAVAVTNRPFLEGMSEIPAPAIAASERAVKRFGADRRVAVPMTSRHTRGERRMAKPQNAVAMQDMNAPAPKPPAPAPAGPKPPAAPGMPHIPPPAAAPPAAAPPPAAVAPPAPMAPHVAPPPMAPHPPVAPPMAPAAPPMGGMPPAAPPAGAGPMMPHAPQLGPKAGAITCPHCGAPVKYSAPAAGMDENVGDAMDDMQMDEENATDTGDDPGMNYIRDALAADEQPQRPSVAADDGDATGVEADDSDAGGVEADEDSAGVEADDDSAGGVEADDSADGEITMSEIAALKEQVRQLAERNKATERALKDSQKKEYVRMAEAEIGKALRSGKLTKKLIGTVEKPGWARAFAYRDLKGFRSWVADAPQLVEMGERGTAKEAEGSQAVVLAEQINTLAMTELAEMRKTDPRTTYTDAVRVVNTKNRALAESYDRAMSDGGPKLVEAISRDTAVK